MSDLLPPKPQLSPEDKRLLARILRDSTGALASEGAPPLADEERARIAAFETEPAIDPHPLPFPARFAAQVRRAPHAPAVVWDGQVLTYAELDERANRLARHLRTLGIGPESRVGVCLERTPELVVALLGILKAGGAYLPLEPHFPATRITSVLCDAGAALLVTRGEMAAALHLPCAALAIDDAEVRARIEAGSSTAPDVEIHPESLAHVIYTSGSTGTPKGVMIRHGSVASLLSWMRARLPLAPGERVLGSTSVCFDVHMAEVHHTLSSGGALVLVENALSLAGLPADAGIVQASMVPTAARELLALGALPGTLRRLNLGGEPVPADLARDLYAAGVPEVHNLYGPTEDTTYSTHAHLPPDGSITIGRPVAGARACVLDERFQPVAIGAEGDLYLAGPGLSRGYLASPALTAARYLPDPRVPGERMYATGDRARWLESGELEYLGRADFQVKVRGYRIEPGEIEAVLRGHPCVADAVVAARGSDAARRLVAWVTAKEGAAPAADDLAEWVKARLPGYMVPAAFVAMDAFPRTASGKTDRRALPDPEPGAGGSAGAAPRTQAEEVLAGLWADVLGLARVGITDDFFDLGGHSLLATRLLTRIRDVFGVDLSVRAVFDAPTVAALAERIARAEGGPALPEIPRADRGRPLPASAGQRQLWFLDRLQPGGTVYNLPVAVRLRGPLDAEVLARALAEIVRRHQVLRTTFAEMDGEPVQVIAPAAPVDLPVTEVAETELHEALRAEWERPFDLARGPLFRARLFRSAPEDHVLLISLHHVVADGGSAGVLLREVSALYAAFREGGPSPLAEPPIQFADYAAWQRAHLSGRALNPQLAWWRDRLAGAPATLELPTDRPRPAVPSHHGAGHGFTVPRATADALRALARREGATPFMALLAAYAVLLSRWSGQDDVVIGSPLAGRTRAETEGLVGFFANTLPLRADLGGDPSFRVLLARVREATLGAHAHQDVPFDRLVDELVVERDASRNPLFQAVFLYHPAEPLAATAGLRATPVELPSAIAKFDLTLGVREEAEGLRATLQYATGLFDAATIGRMGDHFRLLLDAAVADPDLPVSSLPVLSDQERARIASLEIEPAAGTHSEPFPARFAARVRSAPDAPALVSGDQVVTYGELDARANRLANHLRTLGIGTESRVGVCLERAPELVVSLLGILKCGAAYVSLEPYFPPDRIKSVLDDAGASLLVTRAEKAASMDLPCPALAIDDVETRARIEAESAGAPDVEIHPESLAHVIYTSGSTGKPKGVMIRHGSVAAFLAWMERRFPIAPNEKVLGSTSICFDVHVAEVHHTLSSGGVLVLVENALSFAALPADLGIVQASMVPTAAQELLRLGALPGTLRRLNLGGEPVAPDLARDLYAAGVPEVHNLYGPTEDTTYSTHAHIPPDGHVTIGRQIAGSRAYVLDAELRVVPMGVIGDLYLAGAGVSRGYLARPGMTAERYLPDVRVPGERMYTTGDRARWLPNGELEYFGRSDFQVKVRGYRIEPGEIEAVLRGHPRVDNAVVAARGEESARRLVSWIIPLGEGAPATSELADWVRERLPEYMVPSAFVVMEAFPRTTSGKVDRKALPDPDFAAQAQAWVAPRTPAEQLLAGIFAEVLQVDRIGAGDDFFDLGGHSLLATRLVSRVREVFGVEMPVGTVFDHPTLARLADRITRMEGGPVLPPVAPVERDGPLPLSFSQQRLWFLDQLEPGGSEYNVPVALRLRGAPDVAALERALGEIVRRHQVLRTTFVTDGDEPVQVIAPPAPFHLEVEEVAEDGLAAALLAEAERPFDLARGPLFRARLFRIAPDDHALVATTHHAVTDGWSVGVLFRELEAIYGAFVDGRPSPLPEPAIQYADFAVWQRTHQAGVLRAQAEYWRQALAGAPPALELPTDRPRPPAQSHRGASHAFMLPPESATAVKAMARREGATLYMALLAAWSALLGRYAGQEDVVVGSPVAGRTRSETEGLIGFFVNTLALRTRLDGEPTVRQLLARVREATLAGFANQDVPFERVVEVLGAPRVLGRGPVFQVMFVLQDGAALPALAGLETVPAEVRTETAKFDLTLSVEDRPEGLAATLQYATDLFDPATVERMGGHLRALLEGMAADPARRVADVPFVTEAEREALAAWNHTAAEHPAAGIVERFEGWAARTPDATAVACEERSLSYAQANAAANRLAHHLRALGVTAETRVGICLERGVDAVVAVLAVLKAGGAYVPADPAWPADRIGYTLADAGVAVVLTEGRLAQPVQVDAPEVVLLDEDAERIAAYPASNPEPVTEPDHLAYVIYTSGSTGRPKGVMIAHRQLANYVDGVLARLDLPEGASFGTVSTLAADLGNTSVFPALCTGGALHVVTHDRGADPDAFAQLLRRAPVDVLKITPSHLAALLSAAEPREVLPRRRLVLGGEASRTEWIESIRRLAPGLRILNHYGPTETTVGVLTYAVDHAPRTASGSLPLGRPLGNSRVYVLDPRGRELPVGVPGELCIGGAGVGRGYLARPGMTAEKFVPDPLAPEAGARMYRTGDRARRLADGSIEFLGRVDDQVKIRGFRIEPGEVGAVLSRHPGLREAAVVARTVEGEARLAAYVVAAGAEAPSAAELRAWLRRDLPEAMVPSAFVTLDALPLTANGKVDRRALPEPEWAPDTVDAAALRTPAEEMLAGLWAELLGVERVGADDNFFELGGHSLLATRMLSGIRRVFGVEVPVRALFEAPTVAGLADAIARAQAEGAAAAPPIVPVERDRPLPLSFAQQRLWFLDQLEPGSPFYNMPYALRLAGALDAAALERALGALVERHESLRTVFAAADGDPVQRVTPFVPFILPIEAVADEGEAKRVAEDEALRPFDLSRGPLFRARLLRIATEDHVLLVTVHHAVSDGWSLDVLFRELGAFYAAFAEGSRAPLPPPAVQYADYAVWQRRWLHGAALDAQMEYWRGALAGAPPALELPTDRPRPPAQTFSGALHEFHLPPEVAQGVRALARKEGATVFMTLLAAFNVVLARWSGQDDVVVGSPMAGRTRPELEGVVGFFINTLPLRTDLAGDPSFRELMARVRTATLGAYAHQELPFERLVDDLKVERDPSRNPLFQVTFVLQNEPRVFEFGGVKVGPLEVESGTAKFDLTLAAQERSDGIACAWEYNTGLFDPATIERLTGHLARVIAAAVADPARPVSAIDLLGEDERALLAGFSTTAEERADASGLLARIAEHARRNPGAVAVASGADSVTWAQLDARASRLARHLRARGVQGEARVGICLERGPELVAAVLAVLRAGGAYVPIDPAYPPERRAYMLADSGAVVLVTRQALAGEMEPGIVPLVRVDADAATISAQSAEPLGAADDPAALAYVIYTSGSTGRPKGVEVTRRGLRNLVDWHTGAFVLVPGDRTTLVAGVGFDASAWEIWPALSAGAALHVPADEERSDPVALQRWMVEQGITVSFLPTPLAEAVLPLEWPADTPLRFLLTGGDALRVRPSRHLPFILVNNYGPTECAVVATSGRVDADGAGAPDIGRAIDGARVYVLDTRFCPAPVGVPGELCIGGAGVARGYGGRPALTAAQFVPDPFGAEPGARMYRTGDRVRWRPDGRIEFLGRMDQQVKVRGYRIELGEIEAALLARDGVREAVVVLHQAPSGDRRLVGYVVADEADRAGLRDALRAELPDYMVPAAIVRLDALPLTPNGKLDRRALPAPEFEADGYLAPRTPAEEVLAAIWAEVLGAPRVGVHDGFFDLGGHSLLATRVVSRVREAFRVELPLRALFEAPTVAELAARIAREEGGGVLPPVGRADRETPPPLSFAQQRLWFLDQLEPGSAAYNVPTALRIRGPLDVAALERALGAMAARHESLRTTFVVPRGSTDPVQVIAPAGGFRLPLEPLHGVADPEAEARRVAAAEAATPFDLAHGPLFRARLLRLAQDDRVLLITLHHAISDGWSMGVFWRELRALYAAFLRGENDPLAPLPVQYADYAVWQRAHLSGPVLDAQLRWWRERLAGAPAALNLPTDRPRPAVQSYRGASHSLLIPQTVADGLRTVSRREGATLYMTLLAAFNVLLSRWSGQEDLVVGSPVAGRARGELEGLIGFFVNSLPLRTDLSGDPAFRDLLRRVRESTLEAHANQDVPFERLVEEVKADRDPSRSPVFQVLFAFQEDGAPPALEGAEVARMPLGATTSKFDLTLGMREDGGDLYATLYFAADLFDASTIERMGGHLRTLLDAVVAHPERRISQLPLLTDRERAEQAGWYAGPPVRGAIESFPALFAARVAEAPDAVALVHGDARMTYAELDARANRIAHHLRRIGVGPEVRVGLCLERTPELVAAALGILKTGGAYVPVEPYFPPERIAAVMRDASAAVLVTSSTVADSVDLDPSIRVLRMDADETRAEILSEPEMAPRVEIHPESLSHVIYTSGSTGRPKGVMIRHSSVAAFVAWIREAFPLEPGEKVLASTSVAFDVHVAELHYTLATGGTLVLVENALSLAELGRDHGIVQASMVPGAARELLALGALPGGLRRLNLGGEPLPVDLARALYDAGVPEVHNLYGPTEDTTYSTHLHVPADADRVTVGRPLGGRRAYVLDGGMKPVPTGIAGDLYLAGSGTARGYLARPDLTADKFVPDPFGAPGDRLYATGDRARWLPDGQIEYLGRADFQVKIRGFRIELGEIESVLRAHPSVADAVVVAHGAEAAKRLVAYVVAAEGQRAGAAELAAHLKARLPEYMVPSVIVPLDAFPRTTSGKLARKALPAPQMEETSAYMAPSTRTEEALAGLWAGVLGLDRVSARAHFFDLGGHSLLATRLVAKIRDAFQVELPLRAIFEAPVLVDLARRIEGIGAQAVLPPVAPVERNGPLPLGFAQQRLWFLHQLQPESSAYNVPAALRLRGVLDVAALERALGAIVARHEALRTTFAAGEGNEPVQVIHPATPVHLAVETVDGEAEARRRAAAEAEAPFDLAHGPLFRTRLVRIAPEDHVLLITLHHAVSDGWSTGVLFRELSALYAAFAAGQDSPLPPLPVQYADYAVWQRRHLSGLVLDAQLRYWQERLAGAPAALALPEDHPRPATQSYRGAAVSFDVDASTSAGLRALARAEGATPYMTLLAAFSLLLSRWAGQEDVVVGSPVSGRERGELQELIGFFVNTLPLRADLSGDPTFRQLLGRVRETVLQAHAHQDVAFERLVDALKVERDPGRTPLFQAMFLLQEAGTTPSLAGLRTEVLESESATSKFDLTLGMADEGGALRGTLQYAADLFEPSTIQRMAGHLRVLLDAIAADPDRRVSEVPLLADAERTEQAAWYAGPPLPAIVPSFPAAFAARVAQAPDAVALVHGDTRMTYAELDARANRIAHHLRRLGVGPEMRVGLCLERTAELIAAALGILKTGGAYVPVEPYFPPERIAAVMRDASAAVLVTSTAVADSVDLDPSIRVLRMDADETRAAIAAEAQMAPAVEIHPESLSHVIYTSGSTGRPKGVMIRHSSVAALVAWMRDAFPLQPGEKVLGSTSVAFDVHVAELHYTLATGGTLVLVENALSLAELGRDHGIVQASMVPGAARELLALGALPGGLRRLNLGGEPLPADLARALYDAGVPEVHNLYGPTEDTTYSTHLHVPADAERVTVGRPLGGRRAYVLDGRMNPVPAGVAGDLYLAGSGTGRGYLGRPDMTAASFVPDPFGAPGERMYATGDRARWLAGGQIEYLGRADFQVKVRGFRIELGEIESVLRAHSAVRDAAVLARGADGAKRLVAYVVFHPGQTADAAELGSHVRARLPEYMAPAAFLTMDAFPRTTSGKLDRKALPEVKLAEETGAYVAPSTRTEEVLCSLWAGVLDAERVSAHAHFFDLGGHSLLATRLVAKIRDAFQVELPLRAVFEAPVLADLARRIDGMGAQAVLPPVVPVERNGPLPLGFAQQRLWFLHQLEPGSAAYNLPAALRLRGVLDVAALERALGDIVARHQALRTTFAAGEGNEPVQVVHPASPVHLAVETVDGEAEARRKVAAEAEAPFDLSSGPLFRARLIRIAPEDHVLLLTLHHAVSDGWSMGVLWRELRALYGAHLRGQDVPLPPLPVQYADYAVWQREHLAGPVLDAQLRYWKDRLGGAPAALALPEDHPRPATQSYRGASVSFDVDASAAAGLRALARAEGATSYMTLLAAFSLLLSRWAGQDEVVVGSPVAGRERGELQELIGFFVNTLPLRADLSGDPTFRQLLARIRETVLQAHAHQDVPFERLVDALKVERDPGRTPLFQAMFLFQEGVATPSLPGLETEPFGTESATSKFDLTLGMSDGADGLRGTLQYAADLFEPSTIQRMAGHLRVLLDAVAADPDRRVSEVPLLADAERTEQAAWYAGPPVRGAIESFPAAFAARVAQAPDAVALVHGDTRMSYAQLDARANRIAHHLRRIGVGPEVRVGLCLERTPELIAAVLGILKAGGAYVPVEPYFPPERIAAVMRDASAAVLVTSSSVADSVPLDPSCRVLRMDADETLAEILSEPETAPRVEIHPEALAHVIYTSGSTGRPKGVMIRHSSVAAFVAWMRDAFPLGGGEKVLGSTSIAFDVHAAELHYTLAAGGTLVLVENALSLADLPRDHGIVQASMVPGAARELLALGALPGGLRRLNLAGEALPADLARALYAAGMPEVHNVYGPTEDTTYSTHVHVPGDAPRVTIGRPFRGRRAYVLDGRMNPVPAGVTGDLYLAGAGVARGYLGRPDLTATAFVPDPFGAAGERMYATGDRARWLANGEIEYLGRADFQVKVRGFRIELGEIESVLRAHPAVRDAAVLARGADGAKRLVAYVVHHPGQTADAAELGTHVRARLPEYMAPAAYVAMDAFPRTSSGKLDRKALPEPQTADEAAGGFVAPRTPTEQALAGIWMEILKIGRVGAEDSFFDLGGHSLLATRVIARVREALRVELPLRAAFEAKTLAQLAERVDQAARTAAPALSRVIRATDRSAYRVRGSAPGGPEGAQAAPVPGGGAAAVAGPGAPTPSGVE